MINVSNQFKQELVNGNRNYVERAEVTLADGTSLTLTNENFWSGGVSIEDAVSSDSSFDVGSAIVNKSTLTLNNIYDDFSEYVFENAEVLVYVGLNLSDGTTESIRKGTYSVDDAKYNGSIITLECLDNMRKFEKKYSESNLTYPATLKSIVLDACNVCGVLLNTYDFPNSDFVVQTRPNDEAITFREVISWAAQIACCFARCNAYGYLELKWFDQTAFENADESNIHYINESYSSSVSLNDVVITGVKVQEQSDTEDSGYIECMYGTDGYVISLESNKLVQKGRGNTVASLLGEQLVGFAFRKANITHLSDPTFEAGDIAHFTDRKGNTYNILVSSTRFHAFHNQTTISSAEEPSRNGNERFPATTKNNVEWRKALKKEKTQREAAIKKLSNSLANASGMYSTQELQDDGSTIYYLHDKSTIEESQNVIKITSEAIGLSTDGGESFPAGIMINGDVIARILSAEGVNADWLNTGALTVSDSDGNIIFQADIANKKVVISGSSVMIGDKDAETAISDLEKEIQNSVSLVMQMDNEYQGIPTDSEGNYETFPDNVKTTVKVMNGNKDITSSCTYSISKSAGISGYWNGSSYTYTVTGLSSDNGWVDITATYFSTLTVTKRMSLSKIKSGADGRSYFLKGSANVIKIQSDNSLNPSFVEYRSYYRDGKSTNQIDYDGIFIIEETMDGTTWYSVYESDEPEAYVKHNIITDDDFAGVRCTLYSPDKAHVIDTTTAMSAKDVTALTHEDILNLLTKNGEIKGIYKEGNQLYISFTYAKGGELTLGGESNGNGKLRIVDASGKEVGYIDNTGVHFDQGSFTGTITSGSGKIAGWTISETSISSVNNLIKLLASGAIELIGNGYIKFGETKITTSSNAMRVNGGLWVYNGTEEFSDGSDQMKFFNLQHVTSGGHIVFGQDGATVSYLASSSKRYKDFLRLITNEDVENAYNVDVVLAKYNDEYNLDKSDPFYQKYMPMFFAEDIEKNIPSAAVYRNGQIEDWNERVMIPVMFQMIKQLRQEIEEFKNGN